MCMYTPNPAGLRQRLLAGGLNLPAHSVSGVYAQR